MNPQTQYINHQLNNSYCKYAFKFAKQKRFKSSRRIKTQFSYANQQPFKKNGIKFPIGKRVSVQNKNDFPPPNAYSVGDLRLEQKNNKLNHIKGGIMGFGRQLVRFKSMMSQCDKKAYLPAPNVYDMPQTLKKTNISIKIKLPTELQVKLKKAQTPGPGQYKLIQINQSGKYSLSNVKNVRKIFLDGQKRYPQFNNISVSPNKYHLQNVKNYRKTAISFAKAKRKSVVSKYRQSLPGPGMYQTFSQFGNFKNQSFQQVKLQQISNNLQQI